MKGCMMLMFMKCSAMWKLNTRGVTGMVLGIAVDLSDLPYLCV